MGKPGYTPKEAARAAGVNVNDIHNAIASQELEARRVGEQAVVRNCDLKRWLASRPKLVPTRTS